MIRRAWYLMGGWIVGGYGTTAVTGTLGIVRHWPPWLVVPWGFAGALLGQAAWVSVLIARKREWR